MCLAIPGRIIEVVDVGNRLARVDVAGVQRNVNIGLLDSDPGGGVGPGDWVLIHVGFAMSKISEEDALDQMRTLTMLGEQQAAMEEVSGYAMDDLPDQIEFARKGT